MFERDSFGVNKNKLFTRRMFVLSAAKIIVFTGIIGRIELIEEKFYVNFFSDLSQLYLINVVTSDPMKGKQ